MPVEIFWHQFHNLGSAKLKRKPEEGVEEMSVCRKRVRRVGQNRKERDEEEAAKKERKNK